MLGEVSAKLRTVILGVPSRSTAASKKVEANLYCSQVMYQYPLLGLLDLPLGGLLEDLLLIAGQSGT